jgi:hypothetical protein
MDFGATISRAIRVTWDHKVLWILGFLAALGSGGAGNVGNSPQSTFRFGDGNGNVPPWMQGFIDNPGAIYAGLTVFACLIVVISIILFVISLIARGGLIAGVEQVETGGNTTFGRAWSVGTNRFWHMLGLNILIALPIIVLVIILGVAFGGTIIAAVAAGTSASGRGSGNDGALASLIGGGIAILCCLFCIVFLYGLLAQAIQTFGERAIVLENAGITASISRAWAVFRANLGNIILLALIMLFISIVFGIITGAVLAVILVPTMAPIFVAMTQNGTLEAGSTILAIFGLIVASIVGAIINALYVAFNSATWTLAYRQFTGAAPVKVVPMPTPQPPAPVA